jgi:hypothetical protein
MNGTITVGLLTPPAALHAADAPVASPFILLARDDGWKRRCSGGGCMAWTQHHQRTVKKHGSTAQKLSRSALVLPASLLQSTCSIVERLKAHKHFVQCRRTSASVVPYFSPPKTSARGNSRTRPFMKRANS